MKQLVLSLALLFACQRAFADSPQQWLDDYYAILAKSQNERFESVLTKHPEWKGRLDLYGAWIRAEEAMYRYLFVYHIEHATGALKWRDGDWILSIAVCNCGKEGSVPTAEFERLFRSRSDAMALFHEKGGKDALTELQKILREIPIRPESATTSNRIAPLQERFEALVKKPIKRGTDNDGAVPHRV